MKTVILFEDSRYVEYPLNEDVIKVDTNTVIKVDEANVFIQVDNEKQSLKLFDLFSVDKKRKIMLFDEDEKLFLKELEAISIGKDEDFQIDDKTFYMSCEQILNPKGEAIYINGCLQDSEIINVHEGDVVLIEDLMFLVHLKTIKVKGNHLHYTCRLPQINSVVEGIRDFPNYRRSPRVIKRFKEEKVDLLTPPSSEKMTKGGLLKIVLTPLISGLGTIAMSILMPRGPYMLIGLVTTGVSLIFSVSTFLTEKKEQKIKNEKRKEIYENYLLKTRKKLEALKQKEDDAFRYHFPNIPTIKEYINEYTSRIYEKDINDDDFLNLCVGTRREKRSFSISLNTNELEMEKDELLEEAREIRESYRYIENKPMTIDLKKSHVGLVGDKEEIHAQLKQLIAQITFFQSYHDIELVLLYNEAYKDDFDYVKWYPHFRISAVNVTGNIYMEKVRDQVLSSLAQILKQRKEKVEEKKKESSFYPHYIIIIDDYHLIMNHSIMEYLQEEGTNLGFSLIFSAKQRADLPENINTVLLVEDLKTTTLLLDQGNIVDKQMDAIQLEGVDLEEMARNLSLLVHHKGIKSQIPESITFFEMYKIDKPEELNVYGRWQNNHSHKSLAVPLGVRAKDDIVELNLHEKSHGPHGLVAGTTGSGKSEIIQSYILSLAVNFHPHEVGFLLIDYKGGGMASLFKNLPHLLGTITNLDGSESMRALASIKSELQRRQRIFNEHSVNNIIQYNKLFKSNKAQEPLPSLFIISDEFAELKKEQPEFMSELVSAARIGRSLGVKLILATQKPSGVVDDQIWSNSKFKLALKVQNEGDSKEVIKTPDAAYITQPGRSYLQVGNNEIYELFQSAWSGATYSNDKEEQVINNFVYKINDIGQAEIINKDLSENDEGNAVKSTQLDVTVDYINELYEDLNTTKVRKPWLPSLATQIVSPHIKNFKGNLDDVVELDLRCPLGIVDIPEEQAQSEYVIDFVEEGNLVIFASSGFGKSFTLGTIMSTLAVKNNPNLLTYYIIDLGNSALIPYMNLAHTADYMTFDSIEKLTKFMKLINEIVKERKQLFAQAMVQNFKTYNDMHKDKPLKSIFIFLDNYDVIRELPIELDEFIMRISRDGAGLGIYCILTATRSNVIRFATLNNFKNKIAQYMYDATEVAGIVGRGKYQLPEIKGRALIKLANVNIMQVYTPIKFETEVEFTLEIQKLIRSITDGYTGAPLKGIPVLPESFTTLDFHQYEIEPTVNVKAGLCVNDVVIVDAQIVGSPYLIYGPQTSGKTNLLELYINQMKYEGMNYLFDSNKLELYKYSNENSINYVSSEEDVMEFMDDLYSEVEDRKDQFQIALDSKVISPLEFYNSLPPYNIFIDDAEEFIAKVEKKDKAFINVLKEASNVGIRIIATAHSQKLKGYDDYTKLFKASIYGVVLGVQGTTVFPVSSSREYPSFGQGLVFNNGNYRRIQIPKYAGFNEENQEMN